MVVRTSAPSDPSKSHPSVPVGKYILVDSRDTPLSYHVTSPLVCVTGFPISYIADAKLAFIPAIFMLECFGAPVIMISFSR